MMPTLPAFSNADPLWVFGYGSLMWRPGFAFEEKQIATVSGFHRAFCILSHHHRGTAENPGLVLGLDHGGNCTGMAFRVAPALRDETIAYLREREQVTNVYKEAWLPAVIAGGGTCEVLAYVVDRDHSQYSGELSIEAKRTLIRQGSGISGLNTDYARSTYEHLVEIGIEDTDIARLMEGL